LNFARTLAGLVVMSSIASGCVTSPFDWKRVPKTEVSQNDLVIEAVDGSFTLDPGERTRTPFFVQNCPLRPDLENWRDALHYGARRVRVSHPAFEGQLYGIMVFCPIPEPVTGPASSSYFVRVPDSYVQETNGGRHSVVWEPVEYTWQTRDGAVSEWPGWVLWLSRSPFME
jgi:hypothetical protein